MTLMLIAVGLSGCTDTDNINDEDGKDLNGNGLIKGEGKITFLSTSNNIHMIDPDGKNEVRLTEGTESVMPYIWSPDSKKIAYLYSGIYIIDSDGTNKIEIVSPSDIPSFSELQQYCWSPDGEKILFTIYNIDGGLYTVNADGSNLVKLVEGWCSGATFSLNGEKIIYGCPPPGYETKNSFSELYLYSIDSDGTNKNILLESQWWVHKPILSPDGKKIVFSTSQYCGRVCVVNSDGTNAIEISGGCYPCWTADSKKIVYSGDFGDKAGLIIANSDGTGITTLIEERETYHAYLPHCLSPDGKKIVYSVDRDIYIVNIDGSGKTWLATGQFPQWSPV